MPAKWSSLCTEISSHIFDYIFEHDPDDVEMEYYDSDAFDPEDVEDYHKWRPDEHGCSLGEIKHEYACDCRPDHGARERLRKLKRWNYLEFRELGRQLQFVCRIWSHEARKRLWSTVLLTTSSDTSALKDHAEQDNKTGLPLPFSIYVKNVIAVGSNDMREDEQMHQYWADTIALLTHLPHLNSIDFRRIDLDGVGGLNFTSLSKAVVSREWLTSLTLVVADHCGSHEDHFVAKLLDQLGHLKGLRSLDISCGGNFIPRKAFSLSSATYLKLSCFEWTVSVNTDVVRFFAGLPSVQSLDLTETSMGPKTCKPVSPADLKRVSDLPIFRNLLSLRITIPQGKDMASRTFFQLELPLLAELYISAKDYDHQDHLRFNVFDEMAGVNMPPLNQWALEANQVYPTSAQYKSIKNMLANKALAKLTTVKIIYWCAMYWNHETGVDSEDMDMVNRECGNRGVHFQLRYLSGNRLRWNGETSEGRITTNGENSDESDDTDTSEVKEIMGHRVSEELGRMLLGFQSDRYLFRQCVIS